MYTMTVLLDDYALLSSVVNKFEKILEDIAKDFYQQKTQHLPEIKRLSEEVREDMNKASRNNDVFSDMEYIRVNLENISYSIKSKITRRVLFSKWAVNEMNVLLSNARECMDKMAHYVESGDGETGKWLKDRSDRCLCLCDEYNENRRQRNKKGTCYMEASTIYKHILDSFRNIFKHINCASKGILASIDRHGNVYEK
jgi:Na+/phosphate symporter